MDQEKKKELAEMDSRWSFEKTIEVPIFGMEGPITWEKIRNAFNELQENQGDLYMTVDKLPEPSRLDKAKIWFGNKFTEGEKVTFHHAQVYRFYEKLANELGLVVGEAIYKVLFEKQELRKYFELGETVNVDIGSVGDVAPEKSKVSKDELQEMIDDE